MTSKKCQQCKQQLSIDNFIGEQKRCKLCANSRRKHNILCEKCNKNPNFGLESEGKARWCKEHSPIESINLKSKRCEKCNKIPVYGLEEEAKVRWCKEHSPIEAIDLKHQRCEKCNKNPVYGSAEEGKMKWCKEHSPIEAIDLKHQRCEKCNKRSNFGIEDDGKTRWCKEHSELGAIDLKSKRCEKCNKIPYFGLVEEGKVRWCKEHSELGAIDLQNKRCEKCNKISYYGFKEDGKAIWCKEHSLAGAVNLKDKRCEKCNKIPIFGFVEEGKRKWCKEHSHPDAIDLKNRKCEKCDKQPTYGFIGCLPKRCSIHKEEGMFKKPKAKCLKKECTNLAIYGCSRRQIHCEEHKTENDISLAEYKCKNCGSLDILTDKGICLTYCALDEKFKEFKKHEKKDEKRILKLLSLNFGEPSSYDKIVKNDCGNKERPDIVYDFFESKVRVIIEIDENGDNHGTTCELLTKEQAELNRMINIFNSFAETTHTIFIRYNPNTFYNNNVKNKITKQDRENMLVKYIKEIINKKPLILTQFSPLAVIYLFYNEYSPPTTTFKSINILKNKIYRCKKCYKSLKQQDTLISQRIPRMFLFYDKQEYRTHKNAVHTTS